MIHMQKPNEPRPPASGAPAARKAWSRPELVAYGHLAKLTRGPSGNMTETGGLMRGCL